MHPLISVEDLASRLRAQQGSAPAEPRIRLLDVRWSLAQPDGREAYEAGHIPGAAYVDLDAELSRKGAPEEGRHPLPTAADFQRAARRWGLRAQDEAVVYDAGGNLAAARAWWLLRHHGFARVRLLDGALPAWIAAGHPLEQGSVHPEPGDVSLAPGAMPVLELAEVQSFVQRGGSLLDARAGERYRGETEPIDPRAGHIPGAISTPTTDNLDADGCFLPAETLRARFAALGVRTGTPVASYCGSGVTAAHNLVALAIAGLDGALYPGSWSQWSNHEHLPVAVGAD